LSRFWIEGLILGICIGLAAFWLQTLLVNAGTPLQWLVLVVVGVVLCAVQYILARRKL
jgi:uncharacterized membrane-anchored protein